MQTTQSGKSSCTRVIIIDSLNKHEKAQIKEYSKKKFNNTPKISSFMSSIKNLFCGPKETKIPSFIFTIIDYLMKHSTKTVYIFRLSGDIVKCKVLLDHIIKDREVNLKDYDVHTICNALRHYIRDTLDGLIPKSVSLTLRKHFFKKRKIKNLEFLPFCLDDEKRKLIIKFFELIKEVDKNSDINKMTVESILKIVAPTVFSSVVQQRRIQEFLPFVDFMKEIYKMDFTYVPLEYLNK